MTHFELGPIRPPDEADSLLIRTTRGCPWNRCAFCTLYKGFEFSIRPVEDIKKDIWAAQKYYGERRATKCFLQDGDSFAMKTKDLIEVLGTLKQAFPYLKQISSYGRGQSMNKKSASEIQEIADAGLNLLYCDMESGSDAVLKKMRKGTTCEAIRTSAVAAQEAGMDTLLFTILGLGGKELTKEHAAGTAELINAINPSGIRVLTLAVKSGTRLAEMEKAGEFTMLTEAEMIEEQQRMLEGINKIQSRYGNYHAVNLMPELQGELPRDKEKMLSVIKRFLSLDQAKQLNFIFGRRQRYYGVLDDLENADRYRTVQKAMNHFNRDQLEKMFHDQRKNWI